MTLKLNEDFARAINDIRVTKVLELCEEQGYGFVMSEAARAWRKKDPAAAIVTGPAAAFTEPCGCERPGGCDRCFGCGWQFKRATAR